MNKVSEIVSYITDIAPLQWQESYDNSGLLIGNPEMLVDKALITLDVTEAVIEEAVANSFHLIVSHHPLIFKGIKNILYDNTTGRIITKAIKNDIAIAAMHTNLDNSLKGVSKMLAERLGLKDLQVLEPLSSKLFKLAVYCPLESAGFVRNAMFRAGAGCVGSYDSCSFNVEGFGTFKAGENTHPYVGEKGELHKELEQKIEVIVPQHHLQNVINEMLKVHPYEEVAYDVFALENKYNQAGSGMVGYFENAMSEQEFLTLVKETLKVTAIRHSDFLGKPVKKVALCGGSGFFLLPNAKRCKADAYLTADVKYHDFFEADGDLLLVDAGHFETEQFAKQLIADAIIKKNPKFVVQISNVKTNSVHYFV